MAQNQKIGALTDELIASITSFDVNTNARAYKHAKDLATKGLKPHHYARTNQFEVQSTFEGLDEKFRVLNRDDLAEALQQRLQDLSRISNKWIPEYLSLLLQLSDRPVENTRVEDLEALKPPESPPPLTWADIIKDDPLDEEGIWDDIDYAAESSEDERSYRKKAKLRGGFESPPSSTYEEEPVIDPESCVLPIDEEALKDIEDAQFWKTSLPNEADKADITEVQAIRETLFMLGGLQTSLFVIDQHTGITRYSDRFCISHALPQTTTHLLSNFADFGTKTYRLRQWASQRSAIPLIQTFEAVVRSRLAEFDRCLAELHQHYLVPASPIAVSILEVENNVRKTSNPLMQLAQLVAEVGPSLERNPFLHLEALFERINIAQMADEKEIFVYLARIFFDCLQTYLRPIRKWMERGELGTDEDTFFVYETDKSSEAASLWHDRYALRRNDKDALHSPTFFHPASQRIFNTGKSIVFLKELNVHQTNDSNPVPEPPLDYETVCGSDVELPLSPFSELFDAAFNNWIESKYSLASAVLHDQLLTECGLFRTLMAFDHIYMAADGSLFQDFANALFERMDSRRAGWNDRFLLTELARGTFSSALGVSGVERVFVRTSTPKHANRSVKNLSSVLIDYTMPWSVMNVLRRSSIQVYQRAFTFLLQIYRAKYLIQNIDWKSLPKSKMASHTQLSYKLRYRLIWFTDILRSYLTESIFAPSSADMTAQLEKADDIDAMAAIHAKCVTHLQDQCLLSKNLTPIHSAIISLLDLCVLFADTNSTASQDQKPSLPSSRPRKTKQHNRRRSIMPVAILDDASSDDEEEEYHADAESDTYSQVSFSENLARIKDQFERLVPFVSAGLRSVSRAGGEGCWEMLAEKLEWGGGKGTALDL